MNKLMMTLSGAAVLALMSSVSFAKLPPPTEEAKAKAAEAAAKSAWAGKVDAFKLCLAQDKTVVHYKKAPPVADDKVVTKAVAGATAPASACMDPGPFVYVPAGAAPAATAVPVAPAASVAVSAKKS